MVGGGSARKVGIVVRSRNQRQYQYQYQYQCLCVCLWYGGSWSTELVSTNFPVACAG